LPGTVSPALNFPLFRSFELEADILAAVIMKPFSTLGRTERSYRRAFARDLVVAVDSDFEAGYG